MKAIGIDVGTTTICAVLLDTETGRVLDAQTLDNDTTLEADWSGKNGLEVTGEYRQNPDQIVEKCRALLEGHLRKYEDVASIGLTGQMHGIVYVDAKGIAISPLYTWRDKRGDALCEENGESYAKGLTTKTGYAMSAGFGLTTHYYNSKNGLVPESAVSFCTIPDYVAMRLARETEPLMHQSMAASLGMYRIEQGCFDIEKVERAGMDSCMLPRVTKKYAVFGKTKEGIPVAVALGDNQASFLGAVPSGSRLLVNVGTGSQVSLYCEEKSAEAMAGTEYRPYLADSVLLTGSPLCGGAAYALLAKLTAEIAGKSGGKIEMSSVYQLLNACAEKEYLLEKQKNPEINQLSELTVDTSFNGTRTDGNQRGSIRGITTDNFHLGALALGFQRGICEELYDFYEKFPETTKETGVMIGSGNGIRKNPLLQKIFCERFGMEMQVSAYLEEASCGAALFSLLASGYYKDLEQLQALVRV